MAPPSEQHFITTVIDSRFNALLSEAFLCGLYTLLFGYSLRTLLRKKNKKAYATMLTFLWVLVMLTFAFDWQYHRTAFVIDNDSPIHIAEVVTSLGVKSIGILDNIFSMSCNLLADALLIWRCYILWENKRWVLLPLPILLTAAVVLGSISNFCQSRGGKNETGITLLVIFFAVSLVITFVGTSLIILRILLVTKSSPLTTHTSAYRKIQRILVESGILYTIVTFVTVVTLALQIKLEAKQPSIPLDVLGAYTEAILVPMTGIGPTLIAVRIGSEAPMQTDAGASRTWSRSRALSHLTFKRSVPQNDTFDIEYGVSDHSVSPTNSSTGREGRGHIEKDVQSSDTTP
jgi:hypothetical protein